MNGEVHVLPTDTAKLVKNKGKQSNPGSVKVGGKDPTLRLHFTECVLTFTESAAELQ